MKCSDNRLKLLLDYERHVNSSVAALEKVRTMSVYDNVFDLLDNESKFTGIVENFDDYLRSVDDWESFKYFCIDHEIVIVTVDDYDIVSVNRISDFINLTITELAKESINA